MQKIKMERISKIILFLLIIALIGHPLSAQDKPDALLLYNQGKYKEAAEVCKQELVDTPRNMNSYVVLGWSLLSMGKYAEALSYTEKGLSIAPYDYRVIFITGEALFYLNRNQEALVRFQSYIKNNPKGNRIPTIYYYMGEIYLRLNELTHADIAFSTALYHQSSKAKWWVRLGYTRERKQEYSWALEAYEEALKLNPNLVDASRGKERVRAKLAGG